MSANSFVIGRRPNVLHGTINAGGTLSDVIDKSEYDLTGLITLTNMSLGTITLFAGYDQGTLYAVKGANGANVTVGPVSGQVAISSVVLEPLRAYRYIAFGVDAQAGGLRFALPVRA